MPRLRSGVVATHRQVPLAGHVGLVGGWWTDGMAMPAASTLLGANPPATIGGVIDALATRLIGVPLAGAQRAAVVAFACSRTAGFIRSLRCLQRPRMLCSPIPLVERANRR